MAIFGSVETALAQCPQTPAFAVARAYIAELRSGDSAVARRLAAMECGASEKHELGAGVIAIEQVYLTRARADGFFESHRKYIDIQIVASGEEIMEVVDLSSATVRDAYDEARDLVVYGDTTRGSRLRIAAGGAAVFHPEDVHMPCLTVGDAAALVRKSVLKVPVGR